MNARWVAWALMFSALLAGWSAWGWQGLVVAGSLVAFWMALDVSRAFRLMRKAGQAPLGAVGNAVMLHSQVRPGMTLIELVRHTRSLGRPVERAGAEEAFEWHDGAGDRVVIELRHGRSTTCSLERAANAAALAPTAVQP
jgi:hypothetical protein